MPLDVDLREIDETLWRLHERFVARAGFEAGSAMDQRFVALSLAGEAGEVANLVKKDWRGDPRTDGSDPGRSLCDAKLATELDNVFAYWAVLCRVSGLRLVDVMLSAVASAERRLAEL